MMKKLLKHIRTVTFMVLLVMMLTSSTFVSAQINVVSPEEAAEVAMFYYCLISADKESVTVDSYVVTPLYDLSGNITYYSVDFFLEEEGKGYVLIGSDLSYYQCPEVYPEGTSSYYQNIEENEKNIYYNPFQVYTVDEEKDTYYDTYDQEILREDISGIVGKGNLVKNRAVLRATTASTNPIKDRNVFSINPKYYLENLGYTNVRGTSYSTIETAMDNAGAFNYMYYENELPYRLPGGTVLRNSGHCTLTAISNILMYWRSICCPEYPSNYHSLFEQVLKSAVANGAFVNQSNNTDGTLDASIPTIFRSVNSKYGYSGKVVYPSVPSLSFIKRYINSYDWPVVVCFHVRNYNAATDVFPYSDHATVAFGYCDVECYKGTTRYEYSYVKFFDGHYERGKVYVCWDMIENSSTYFPNNDISTYMATFCPYR